MLVGGKKTLIERPLQELFCLEVHASNTESSNQNSSTEAEPCGVNDKVSATGTRPYLIAAVVAEEKIKVIDHILFEPLELVLKGGVSLYRLDVIIVDGMMYQVNQRCRFLS